MFPFAKNLSLTWLQTYINFAQKLFYREKQAVVVDSKKLWNVI